MIPKKLPLLFAIDSLSISRVVNRLGKVLLLACLWPTLLIASPPPPWTGAISAGGDGYTIAQGIKAIGSIGYFVTGQFSSRAKFSGTTLYSRGGTDMFLAKYDRTGNLLWIVTAGGGGDDVGRSLDTDGENNVYVTGWFTDDATFSSVNGASKTIHGSGFTIFLARYSPDGNLAWVQTGTIDYSGYYNFGYGVAVDSAANNVYISALSQFNTTFSSDNGVSSTVSGVGTWHMVVAQYGTDGNFHWAQTNQANPNSVPSGIAVYHSTGDSPGGAYVTGWLENQTIFSSANGNNINVDGFSPGQSTFDYPNDAFVAKYDQNGNAIWVNHVGGYKAIGNAIAVSAIGDVSLVGFIGNVDSPGQATTIVTSQPPRKNYFLNDLWLTYPYNPDALIVTYTAAGVLKKALRIGHDGSENATGVAYDSQDNLYVAGVSQQIPGDRAHLFLRKYDAAGLVWEQKAQSSALWSAPGSVPAVSIDDFDGMIYVAGGYQNWARFGPSTLTGHNPASMFVAELPLE